MNSNIGDSKRRIIDADIDDDELDDDDDVSEDTTVVLDDTGAFTDNVGDVSVEINVEELIAELEGLEDKDVARKKEIRRRLEELAESRDLDDTYAIEFDD
ncbi:MAG: hypothetical protein R3192_04700 [Woeseiaceae bacterium]|nr:hypothetical protein [Woeseiaceae bacterium]